MLVSGSLSVAGSLLVALPLVYVLVKEEVWQGVAGGVASWLDNDIIKDGQVGISN